MLTLVTNESPIFTSSTSLHDCCLSVSYSLFTQRACSFGGFDLTNRSVHIGASDSDSTVRNCHTCSHRLNHEKRFKRVCLFAFIVFVMFLFFFLLELDKQWRCWSQRCCKVSSDITYFPGQESQVCERNDEETHIQEIPLLSVWTGV